VNPFDGPEYSNVLEGVKKSYDEKALSLLRKIRDLLTADGLFIPNGPFDSSTDTYQWSLTVYRYLPVTPGEKDDTNIIDITLEISEERDYDDAEGFGVNFALDITDYGGRMLGGLSPYNYTPAVWVDARNPEAVAARWRIIEDSDIESISSLITDRHDWDEVTYGDSKAKQTADSRRTEDAADWIYEFIVEPLDPHDFIDAPPDESRK